MAINITAAGLSGAHYLQKVNVHAENDYIYFKGGTLPAGITDGTSYIFNSGTGSISGVSEGDLVYAEIVSTSVLKLQSTVGSDINLTDFTAGTVTLNTPVVYDTKLNIQAATPTNQAVKYYTAGTPLTGLTSGSTYFLKNVSADFIGTQALYSIASNTHTFTTCGQTGRVGPTNSQMQSSYSTSWHGTYLAQGAFVGYQDWVVPVSGVYEFTVNGASGFNGSGSGGVGRGATVKGRVTLTKNEIITIAVGQVGEAPASGGIYGGSGGGTFVVRKTGNEALFVAGGGSAEANATIGRDGVLTELGGSSSGGASGAAAGFGGVATGGFSAGGGGFFSRGGNSSVGETGGGSFLDGLTAADNGGRTGGNGGFGGGGTSDAQSSGQTGGAGYCSSKSRWWWWIVYYHDCN
jgi:hypothetical protein